MHLSSLSSKNKKKSPLKKLFFGKWDFLALILEKLSYSSGNNSLYFRKRNFLLFQEIETLKTSYISGSNFSIWKNKKRLLLRKVSYISQKRNFLAPSLKNFLYFRKELTRLKNRQRHCSREFSCLLWRFCNVYSGKAWGKSLWSKFKHFMTILMFKEYRKFRYFVKYFWMQEMELSSPNLKKLFVFQKRTYRTWKSNKKSPWRIFLSLVTFL